MRALGVDYGARRIGLALSDPTGMLARPWKTIESHGGPAGVASSLADEIQALRSEDDGLDIVVLGFPRRLGGGHNDQTVAVQKLADCLRAAAGVPIVLQDERLTSREADQLLARREKDWRKRKRMLDATAAAVILQDYLDTQGGTRPLEDLDR